MNNPYWFQEETDLRNLAGRGPTSPFHNLLISLCFSLGLKFVTRLCHCCSPEALETVNLVKSPVLSDVQSSF